MFLKLAVGLVVISADGRILDGAVHPLDLSVGPWMIDFGEPVLDAVLTAPHVEHVGHVACRRPIGVARRIAELDAVAHCEDGSAFG